MAKSMKLETAAMHIDQQTGSIGSDQREMREPTLKLRQLCLLDDLLLHCIDEALVDLVGINVRDAIYQKVETTYLIPRAKIPGHLDDLYQLLGRIFGKGNRVIGRAIAKKLFQKLEWQFIDIPQLDFFDYLDMVRARVTRMTGPTASA